VRGSLPADRGGVADLLITAAWSEASGERSGRVFVISGAPVGDVRGE